MDSEKLYRQLKKAVRQLKKQGSIYQYAYMNNKTYKSFPLSSAVAFDRAKTLLGCMICINEMMPDGTVWITDQPPYFIRKKNKLLNDK